jgi:hypothetical protein
MSTGKVRQVISAFAGGYIFDLSIQNKNKHAMNPLENLYYALGEFAYAVACADGAIQKEESETLKGILDSEFPGHETNLNIPEIIFRILKKDHVALPTVYDWAVNEMKANGHYLGEGLKKKFTSVLNKVAESFPPSTREELEIIEKFKKEINSIKGDPVFTHESKT